MLTYMQAQVRDAVDYAAERVTLNRPLTYTDVLVHGAGLPTPEEIVERAGRTLMGEFMRDFNLECHRRRREEEPFDFPLLDSMVLRADTNEPSDGWWEINGVRRGYDDAARKLAEQQRESVAWGRRRRDEQRRVRGSKRAS